MFRSFRIALYLLVLLFAVSANAAPMAYSVNSDSGDAENQDSLYVIDLADGSVQRIGTLTSGSPGDVRRDTEGLAMDTGGTLWGIDDDSLTLFDMQGNIRAIGDIGALGANISAIAGIGNPFRLYGLGNGQYQNGETDSPNQH